MRTTIRDPKRRRANPDVHAGGRYAAPWLVVLLVIVSGSCAWAQNPNLGTSGAKFLQVPVGARPVGMGGAVVSHLDDASSVFWNPAGIARIPSNELFFAYTSWWATIKLSHASIVHTVEDLGTFALSTTVLSMDKMEVTTEAEPEGTGQFFDAQDLMIGVSYARRLTEDFSVGITAKYINQRIWNETAVGVAFDVGTQYRIGFRDLTIAMSMTNFGADMKFDGLDLGVKYDADANNPNNRLSPSHLETDDYPLPLHFQVGVSMTVLSTDQFSLLLAADATHPNDNDERINVGTEVGILQQFFLRGGYRFGYDQESATFGAGVRASIGSTTLAFDYAYALYSLLPNIHRLSLGMSF